MYSFLIESNSLESLAVLIKMKKLYVNGVIQAKSFKELANKLKISESSTNKHVKKLINLELVSRNENSFIVPDFFKDSRFLYKGLKTKKVCFLRVFTKYVDQKKYLKSFNILCNIARQNKAIEIKKSKSNEPQQRRAKATVEKGFDTSYTTISNKKMCQLIGKSKTTLLRYKKFLTKKRILRITQIFEESNLTKDQIFFGRRFNPFFNRFSLIDGVIFEQLTSELKLCI
jgi:response regulator of citrate/malate metabolism